MTWLFVGFVGLGAVGAFWLLLAAARAGEPEIDRTTSTTTFRHGRTFLAFGLLVLLGLPAVIAGLALAAPPKTQFGYAFFAILAGVCFAVGAALTWDAIRYRLRITANGLECRSPWRRRCAIPWSDVASVTYSRANMWFVAAAKDDRKVRISILVPGANRFLESCEARLPANARSGALAGYGWVKRAVPARSGR
ncbi:MAG TPA: PH domain-containing protein [Fimbriiglobus sp.]|jgi:hypothetical protein